MDISKKKLTYAGFFTLIAINVIGLAIPFTMALFKKEAESDGFYGKVALRSYFEKGEGTENNPYVITRPRHLYNLSRLQGLGVFGTKTFFELGLPNDGEDEDYDYPYFCYSDDTENDRVPCLDMIKSDYNNQPINAIGSEATPFYGSFNGHNLEIKNLTVYADPEDSGLFGYTAHGSEVKNLYLSNIDIYALGYVDDDDVYEHLYGEDQVAAEGTNLVYTIGDESPVTFDLTDTTKVKRLDFDIHDYLLWDGQDPKPTVKDDDDDEDDGVPVPHITFNSNNANYKYKFLISGDFLSYVDGSDEEVKLDLASTFYYFYKEIHPDDPQQVTTYPINASSSVSLVASTVDNYGLEHSKVISTMQFDLSYVEDSNDLTLSVHLGEKHSNNIGLLIGHCDGSVNDCYVSSGSFFMNDKDSHDTHAYVAMSNGSNYGLIGKIGGTVHSKAAEDSGGGTIAGKAVGVIDFSSVYKQIIANDDTSFGGGHDGGGIYFTPKSDTTQSKLYLPYLRKTQSGEYVTEAAKTVSFRGQRAISNADLGVFTIATDYLHDGMYENSGDRLDYSVIRKDEYAPSPHGNYYVYYATGEFDGSKCNYTDYINAFKKVPSTTMQLGYHFPSKDQVTSESFAERDLYQNYYFRFKLDPTTRTNKGFYFSDVDTNSDGGYFLSKYFENRLVDGNGEPIPATTEDGKADGRMGVRIQDPDGNELDSLTCSFSTPNMASQDAKMFCIGEGDKAPVANMINFEVSTSWANVTVVAGLANNSKPAAVGVYHRDYSAGNIGTDSDGVNRFQYLKSPSYNQPDYAFFMPADNKLAYFDYRVKRTESSQVGEIGVYRAADNPEGYEFIPADIHTNATVAGGLLPEGYQYQGRGNETRLYAHTFKLPYGKYCLGSATGGNEDDGLAKIYYVCAQGQTDGTLDFGQTSFSHIDEVSNVDFVKTERFTYNEDTKEYDENYSAMVDGVDVGSSRCYISLLNTDRSAFKAGLCRIKFKYEYDEEDEYYYFAITSPGQQSTVGNVNKLVVSSYASSKTNGAVNNTLVKIFDSAVSKVDDNIVRYPPS